MTRSARKIIAPQASPENRKVEIGGDDLPPMKQDETSPAHERALLKHEERLFLVTISDRIAQDTLYTRNFKWDIRNRNFPEDIDAHMRFVTKYYPYPKGKDGKVCAPLYVDEPQKEHEVIQCYAKQKILKKMGLRHIVVESHRVNPETGQILTASTLEDCLEQLGEM